MFSTAGQILGKKMTRHNLVYILKNIRKYMIFRFRKVTK